MGGAPLSAMDVFEGKPSPLFLTYQGRFLIAWDTFFTCCTFKDNPIQGRWTGSRCYLEVAQHLYSPV